MDGVVAAADGYLEDGGAGVDEAEVLRGHGPGVEQKRLCMFSSAPGQSHVSPPSSSFSSRRAQ